MLISCKGEQYDIQNCVVLVCICDGEIIGIVLVFQNVIKVWVMQCELSYYVFYDVFIGLFNCIKFEEEL